MKEIVSRVLLAGERFMPAINLRQPEFIYSAYLKQTKNAKT